MSGKQNASSSKGKKEDGQFDLEQQFILRMPPEAAENLRQDVNSGTINLRDKFFLELQHDMRHGLIRYGDQCFKAKLLDLPCVVEALKTTDNKNFYKTADISQMLKVVSDDESSEEDSEKEQGKKGKDKDKKFQFMHGVTPPLKNVRKKRFRKTSKKKYQEQPDIEKEVKRLLRMDNDAIDVKWEVVVDDARADNAVESQAPPQVLAQGGSSKAQQKEMKENSQSLGLEHNLFGDVSSSDEDEKDINIMDSGGEEDGSTIKDEGQDSMMSSGLEDVAIKDESEYRLSAELNAEAYELQTKLQELTRQLDDLRQKREQLEKKLKNATSEEVKEKLSKEVEKALEKEQEKEQEYEILSSMMQG